MTKQPQIRTAAAEPTRRDADAREVQFFKDNGYLVVERYPTDERDRLDPADLRHHLLDGTCQRSAIAGRPLGTLEPTAREQVVSGVLSEMEFPELLTTNHWRKRRAMQWHCSVVRRRACRLGPHDPQAPGGRPALWHQDHAYWQPELDYYALGVWLPMHDVSIEMGAMQFIPVRTSA
jgi:hypothetical protein